MGATAGTLDMDVRYDRCAGAEIEYASAIWISCPGVRNPVRRPDPDWQARLHLALATAVRRNEKTRSEERVVGGLRSTVRIH